MKLMNIKEVEKKTGFSKPNIRYYEEAGLISPARNDSNNYRVYSDADVEELLKVKKLRLLGVSVSQIRELFDGNETLMQILENRLIEINTDADVLKHQAEICKASIRNGATEIKDIEINERAETWQRRLAVLLRDDIVQHKLTKEEFNRDILVMYLIGCCTAMITAAALYFVSPDNPVLFSTGAFMVILAGVLAAGLAPLWSASIKVHTGGIIMTSVFNVLGVFLILSEALKSAAYKEQLEGTSSCSASAKIILLMFTGLAVMAVVGWMISRFGSQSFKSLLIALILSILYSAAVFLAVNHLYGSRIAAITAGLGLLFSVIMLGQWSQISKENTSFTRYSSLYFANRMMNVIFTVISAQGYYNIGNYRRG